MGQIEGALRSAPVIFAISLLALSLCVWIGATRWPRFRSHLAECRKDFDLVVGATLTLLALLVGFTFSMALGRFDQRKNLEEQEANAIGTEYVRADLLADADAARVRTLLRRYLDERIAFYAATDEFALRQSGTRALALQSDLWAAVRAPALAAPTPVNALALGGMNDVFNAQGYADAARSNRIPAAAWILLLAVASGATLLVGLGSQPSNRSRALSFVLPLTFSIALFLVADIDSPRRGLIRIAPQNLLALSASLHASAPR